MKHTILWLLAAALLSTGCGGNADPEQEIPEIMTAKPTVKKDLSVSSTAMSSPVKYSIWLPPTYDESKTYPVLYLLHGYEWDVSTAHNGWLEKGSLSSIATQYVRNGGELFIIVTPNCPNDFYRDNGPGDNYETFFIKDFIPFIEKTYHGNGKRAIAGLSMGGYGTLLQGFSHPEMFTYMYAMSPATGDEIKTAVNKADTGKLPKITIETGTNDMTVSLASVQDFANYLQDRGIIFEFITRSGGHDWNFWQGCIKTALPQIGKSFK